MFPGEPLWQSAEEAVGFEVGVGQHWPQVCSPGPGLSSCLTTPTLGGVGNRGWTATADMTSWLAQLASSKVSEHPPTPPPPTNRSWAGNADPAEGTGLMSEPAGNKEATVSSLQRLPPSSQGLRPVKLSQLLAGAGSACSSCGVRSWRGGGT